MGELLDNRITPILSNIPPLLRATRRRIDAAVITPVLLLLCTCEAIFCHTSEVVPTIPIGIYLVILYIVIHHQSINT